MRFRTNVEDVLTFSRIIQSIEKLQKRCIVRFTETHMHIICNSESEGGIQVWSQIKVESLFSEYRIQSNADNIINLELSPEALLQALKSATSSPEVVMKLAKKNDHAVLTFEVTSQSRQGRKLQIAHDVRIYVMKPTEFAKIKEPMCPEPDVHVMLPPLQKLRAVVEHLRQMSDVMAFRANNSGHLQLSVHTDSVKVDTDWTDCTNPQFGGGNTQEDELDRPQPEQKFTVHLSVRSFLKFLSSHVVSRTTMACICHGHCMILYVYIGEASAAGGVLTFYIPALVDG